MSSTRLVTEDQWPEDYTAFSSNSGCLVSRDYVVANERLFLLVIPAKYCNRCGRELLVFEVEWDESNPDKDYHCCEICWLWSK